MKGEDASVLSSITGGTFSDNSNRTDELGRNGSSTSPAQEVFTSPKLFGRSRESNQLLESFEAVVQDHTARLVVVHGKSGMGKTALVEESLRKKVCDHQGYFCAGKFFQQESTQEAYSALLAAFSDLCDVVLQAGDYEARREVIKKSRLGTEGYILADLISSIKHFLPPQEEKAGDEYTMDKAALTRFKVACRAFLHAMSDEQHPICIFIDDIQWADEGSRQVIAELLKDKDLQHVLFALTYRDEEAPNAESLIQRAHDGFVDIQVESLDTSAVEELLADQMGLPVQEEATPKVKELSKLVTLKTQGNPFHVHQYLAFILAENLLAFSPETNSWEFDIGHMQLQTMVPDSLVEILERRMDRLSPSVVKTLVAAAVIGFEFDRGVLIDVVLRLAPEPSESTYIPQQSSTVLTFDKALSVAAEEGLIEASTTPGRYLFSHDKILASFLSRTQQYFEPSQLRLAIAECFFDLKSAGGGYTVRAAQHANEAGGSYEQRHGRVALVQLNIEAANYCLKRNVFFAAAQYFRGAADLLGLDGAWESNYGICLELHEKLLEVELILGNFDACEVHIQGILKQCTNEEKRLKAMWYQILVKMAENELVESIVTARDALRGIGTPFPTKVNMLHILRKLFRVRSLLRSKSDDDILNMPLLSDPIKIANHQLLIHIAATSLFEDRENYAIYAAMMVMESTLTEGLSEFSATGLTIYAVTETSLGNYEVAYKYAQLALAMTRKYKCVETEVSTITLLSIGVLHWKEPVREIISPMADAFTGCFASGNLWYGAVTAANMLLSSFSAGVNLVQLKEQAFRVLDKFKEYGQNDLTIWLVPVSQVILHFSGVFDNWGDAVTLTGDLMVEDEYLVACDRTNYKALRGTLITYKLLLAYNFGKFDEAENVLSQLKSVAKVMRLHYLFYTYHFYASMTYIELYRITRKRGYLRKARSHKNKLSNLESIECPNTIPLVKILILEELSLVMSSDEADLDRYTEAMDDAVQACQHANLIQHEAMVFERAGFFFAKHDDFDEAIHHFDHAMELNKYEWGSEAKAEWLKSQVALKCPSPRSSADFGAAPLEGAQIEISIPGSSE